MGVPVVITPTAIADLEEIVRFIAVDSPDRARSFGYTLIDQALSPGPFPEMGRVTPEVGDPDVREIVHGAYRIIYELIPSPINKVTTKGAKNAKEERRLIPPSRPSRPS